MKPTKLIPLFCFAVLTLSCKSWQNEKKLKNSNNPEYYAKTITIIFDRKEFKGKITFLGKETISTAIGKKECYKLTIGSSESHVLQGNNTNFLWLTADANKIPVYGKFKIPVGNGELKIKSASGLKN